MSFNQSWFMVFPTLLLSTCMCQVLPLLFHIQVWCSTIAIVHASDVLYRCYFTSKCSVLQLQFHKQVWCSTVAISHARVVFYRCFSYVYVSRFTFAASFVRVVSYLFYFVCICCILRMLFLMYVGCFTYDISYVCVMFIAWYFMCVFYVLPMLFHKWVCYFAFAI